MIILTEMDWSEIYYALDSKAQQVEEGELGPELNKDLNDQWLDRLRGIMERIGPDGQNAYLFGVQGQIG